MAAVEDQTTLAQPAPAVSASVGAEARLRMALTACNELSAMLPDGPHREHMATISGQVAMAMESIAALAQQPGAQGVAVGRVPDGMVERIESALRRIENGHSPRRIPADPSDVDLVLGEVLSWINGEAPPFWVPVAAATPKPQS
jgi:hypothetical protein